MDEVATKAATCEEYCCSRGKSTPQERAERKKRREESRANAVRLLHFAEKAALEGETEQAKALTEIAGQWDSIGY